MPISMNCPACGKTLSAPDTAAGKKAKCPSCGQIMIVPDVVHEAEDIYASPPEPFTPYSPQPPAGSAPGWLDDVQEAVAGSQNDPIRTESAQDRLGDMQGVAHAPMASDSGGQARRPCPECGEMIVVGAAKCRFCNAIFDPRLKLQVKRAYGPDDENLSTGEWVFCILCAGIACIVGIVYAIQGKPKGMKMVGISFLAAVVWNVLNAMLQFALISGHHHVR